ncbi:MAG: molecular chaperone DnaJ [Thermoleophilia bacterium]|nr:molecular chaperone DnaJ [Thermoleophilia bacterium]
MAARGQDYYEILGVPRSASEREIKKAFRRLARELHPDVSDHPEAGERFREAAEAYEVLSKSETRQLYDRYGHEGLRTGGFRPTDFDFTNLSDIFSVFFGEDVFGTATTGRRRGRGGDIAAEVEIDLVEAAEGVTREVPFPVAVPCPSCDGSGAEPGTRPETCPGCGGAGRVQSVSSSVFGQFVRTQTCPQCRGSGHVVETPCRECAGAGRVTEERAIDVEIPPGIHDGQRIRLTGEGHAGVLGGRAGDLYVLVRIRPDERFVRDGNDVVTSVQLTMTQAALGARVAVPTLEGEVELTFRPATQPGEIHVLRGRGMPVLQGFGRGDLRVLVNVAVPRALSDEQRRLLEEFERSASDENYREGDEGFFEKLRAAFR